MNNLYPEQADELKAMGITEELFREILESCKFILGSYGVETKIILKPESDRKKPKNITNQNNRRVLVTDMMKGLYACNALIQMSPYKLESFLSQFSTYRKELQPGQRM